MIYKSNKNAYYLKKNKASLILIIIWLIGLKKKNKRT